MLEPAAGEMGERLSKMWVQLHRADHSWVATSLLALLLAAPSTNAQAVNPMQALQFYVGGWSCVERKAGEPPWSSTFTFAIESNLMRQWITRPKQNSMPAPYVVNSTFAYDVVRHRYVQTEMDSDATWYVSVAEPWQGNTIHWVDLATSTKLSRWDMTRVDDSTFIVESFAKIGDKSPNYTASCKRDQQT